MGLNGYKLKLSRLCPLQLNFDYRKSIFLAAVGRSGTTWISDVVNYDDSYRRILEPFHPYKVRQVRHFIYYQYIRGDNRDRQYIDPVKTILSGRFRNRWADSENTLLLSRHRFIKDIRANLFLGWMHEVFPEVPIILLFRHPCAVANSWLKLGWGKEDLGTRTDIGVCLSQPQLVADHLAPFVDLEKELTDDFERHVYLWCIQYYVPLRQLNPGSVHLAFYENFCETPEEEVAKVFRFLNKPFDPYIFQRLKIPSHVTRKESAIMAGTSLVDSWRRQVSDGQIERAIDILKVFGLDRIYSEASMPNAGAAYELIRQNRRQAGK